MTCKRILCLTLTCLALGAIVPAATAQHIGRVSRERDHDDRDRDRGRDRERDDHRNSHRRSGPPVARTVRIGTTVTTLTRGAREFTISGSRYYVYEGACYTVGPRRDTYVVVRPPAGVVFSYLPSDYETIDVDGSSYYYYDDAYYNDRLEVVDCPLGGYVTQLPEGYEVIGARDDRVYRSRDLYFKAVIRGGKTVYVRVAVQAGFGGGGWKELGSAKIAFRPDEETIPCGLLRGRFRQIRLEIDGGDVDIDRVTVRFMNGESFTPVLLKQRFDEGSRSRIIDLPGDDRFIKEVRFRAKSKLSLAGKATITVSGR